MFRFGILARYIIEEVLKLLFPIWFGLSFVIFLIEWLAWVFRLPADAITVLQLYVAKIPSYMQLVFPAAVLLSSLIVLGAMNRSLEVVAVQAMGSRRRSILFPLFAAIIIASAPYYLVATYIAPMGLRAHYTIYDTKVMGQASRFSQVRQEKIWYRNQDILYNVGFFDPFKQELYDVTLYTFDENFYISQTISAKKARWVGTYWELFDGVVMLTDKNIEAPMSQSFDKRTTRLIENPKNLKRFEFNADTMTQVQLGQNIKKYKSLGINTAEWEVIYHGRLSFMLISFVFILLAFPRTLKFSRTGSPALDGVFVGVICLVYWLIYSFSMQMGMESRIHPILAAWAPSILFLLGIIFYNRRQLAY
ncbi:MAG: LptF/LptG family permease [Proteobacteria bacterium]|nr:LptF/LptG family permease [Pseudomonadota bacterium]